MKLYSNLETGRIAWLKTLEHKSLLNDIGAKKIYSILVKGKLRRIIRNEVKKMGEN